MPLRKHIPAFKSIGLLPRRGLVIAAVPKDETTTPEPFTSRLLKSYRDRKVFRKEQNSAKLVGKLLVRPAHDPAMCGDHSIMNLDYEEETILYKRPKLIGSAPIRCGKTLDYLLFSKR